MDKQLSLSSYVLVGAMLFGLFFGAGNLIFPVHVGQLAGSSVFAANLGFLITAIGLPFLGVVAIGVSKSNGLFDLASRVHPAYGYAMTLALYLTIGPFSALPRTGTVSYEIGLAPFIDTEWQSFSLAIFTAIFFVLALLFSLRRGKILVWVGKILTPLFLAFLAVLIAASILWPLGDVSTVPPVGAYAEIPFFKGFLEGYNTMDALASLAFGIIIVQTLKSLGVTSAHGIALGTIRAGTVSVLLMALIYSSLAYIGATSAARFAVSSNGGIALAQVAREFFGAGGSVLLAIIVTVACLKTAIGLITACSETFCALFPASFSYKSYVFFFTGLSCLVANMGLTQLIELAKPVLMLLYPLAISLILLGLLSSIFRNRQCVYVTTTLFTFIASIADCLQGLPPAMASFFSGFIAFYAHWFPFFSLGLGWVIPMLAGFFLGIVLLFFTGMRKKAFEGI